MVNLLAKRFIKNYNDYANPKVRVAYGVLCGAVGIFFNILLCISKITVGILSGSIAVTADAFNNLSDAFSSVITIVGFKMSEKAPDSEHRFGHGRFEYIAGLIVSIIIIIMGFELAKTSIEKIIAPENITFDMISSVILFISILVKVYMFIYNKSIGKKLNSPAMDVAAHDSLSDAAATTAVLLSIIFFKLTNINIDAYCGMAVSGFILYSGCGAAKETINPLLGEAADEQTVQKIKEIITQYPDIIGMHDLIIHNYGAGRMMVTFHAEVDYRQNILEMHDEIDNIERHISRDLNCNTTIHMDPIITDNEELNKLKTKVEIFLHSIDENISMHDFRIVAGTTHTNLIFDVVLPYDSKISAGELKKKTSEFVKDLDGNYYAVINMDTLY